jgi:hypothetical protein
MSESTARALIILTAVVLGAAYAWRWLTGEKGATGLTFSQETAKKLIGIGPNISPEGYMVAWGIMCFGLAMLSVVSAPLAGALALLILLASMIGNFTTVAHGLTTLQASKTTTTKPTKGKK